MEHNRKTIYLAGLLFTLPVVLVFYINSSFLENYIAREYVGMVYIVASVLSILTLPRMPKVLNRLGNVKTCALASFLITVSFIVLAFSKSVYFVIPFFFLHFIAVGWVIATLDIFVEDASVKHSIGKTRGLFLLSVNSAWVVSQLISSAIIGKIGLRGVYLLSAGLMILSLSILLRLRENFHDPVYRKISAFKTVRLFIKNKNLGRVYAINLVLQLFYAFMVIYLPIYLHQDMGFNFSQTAIIFSVMLLPFVLLDFSLGKLSDKIGEKEMLIGGFSIATIFTLAIPFIEQPFLWLWAFALFATRIGAAMIEVMSESYFFKVVKEEDADEISFFRNAPSVSYVIAPLLAMPIIFFLPSLKYIFFLIAAILLFGLLVTLKLRDAK